MRGSILSLFIFFCNGYFSQIDAHAIHNSREISITIYGDTIDRSVFIGCFKVQKFICLGNAVDIDTDKVKTEKGDSLVELDFTVDRESSLNNTNQFVLHSKEVLKIRLIRTKGIRIPKKKKLIIYLTINGDKIEVLSKRFEKRFCHHRKWTSIYYKKME